MNRKVEKTRARVRRRSKPKVTDEESLHQEIEMKAYQRYCDHGCVSGFELEDWLAAERETLEEHAKPQKAGRDEAAKLKKRNLDGPLVNR